MNSKLQMLLLFVFIGAVLGTQNARALSVKLSEPRNGSRFERCADITLKAEADIPNEEIRRVIFYFQGLTTRSLRNEPWEYIYEGVPDGIYNVSAKLVNTENESVESDTIQIFVGPVEDGEKLKNGEFACGLAPWSLSLNAEAEATLEVDPEGWLSDEPSMAFIDITNPGSQNWHVMLVQACPLDSGHTYEISFLAEVEEAKTIGVDFQSTMGDFPVHFWQSVPLSFDTYEYGPIEFFCTVTDPSNEFKLAVSENNQSIYIDAIKVIDKDWERNETTVRDQHAAPVQGYRLLPNYPNPFNPSTEIQFEIARTEPVQLVIYNTSGQVVRTLVDKVQTAGAHTVSWDGRDDNSVMASSGIYIYTLWTASFDASRRMLLLK